MKSKKSQSIFGKILYIIVFIILIGLIIGMSYYLYLNIPRNPEKLDVIVEKTEFENLEPVISEVIQFYSNMKFNHNQISYKIEEGCESKKEEKMINAFSELSNKVEELSFFPTSTNPDIEISCTQDAKPGINEKHFVAGEGGAKEIIQTGRFNVITEGIILLYENNKIKTIDCDYPNVELHELLHVFGFDHVNDKKSLMYPFIESCNQRLDLSLIEKLKQLYSQEDLPDLYFENVSVTKKGRYIDFELTIKNSGSVDSDNVILTILDDDTIIEKRDLEEFKFGSGLSLQTKNLKLAHLNPDQIKFIIDKENEIKEIDENNNIAVVNLK